MPKPEVNAHPKLTEARPRRYGAPAVVYEAALEAQAGSPLGEDLGHDLLQLMDKP